MVAGAIGPVKHAPGEENQMKNEALLSGVLAAALTPLSADGRVDHSALSAHGRTLLHQGCDGLVILGTTGEANTLALGERIELLDALAASDLPPERLLIGTGCCAAGDTVTLTRRAVALGAAGVLMLPPFYYKEPAVSLEGLVAHFERVIDGVADSRLRIYLYNIPQLTGIPLGLPLLERLHTAHPDLVVGIKDSSGDWEGMAAVIDAMPGFQVFSGTERLLLPALERGGVGCISATVNVLAPRVAELYRAWRGGEHDEAARLQREVVALRAIIQPYPLSAALKAILSRWSGDPCWETLRPPLTRLPASDADALVAALAAAGL
jgi:4-hydroxy-tetrahydrodipicolinate synthase